MCWNSTKFLTEVWSQGFLEKIQRQMYGTSCSHDFALLKSVLLGHKSRKHTELFHSVADKFWVTVQGNDPFQFGTGNWSPVRTVLLDHNPNPTQWAIDNNCTSDVICHVFVSCGKPGYSLALFCAKFRWSCIVKCMNISTCDNATAPKQSETFSFHDQGSEIDRLKCMLLFFSKLLEDKQISISSKWELTKELNKSIRLPRQCKLHTVLTYGFSRTCHEQAACLKCLEGNKNKDRGKLFVYTRKMSYPWYLESIALVTSALPLLWACSPWIFLFSRFVLEVASRTLKKDSTATKARRPVLHFKTFPSGEKSKIACSLAVKYCTPAAPYRHRPPLMFENDWWYASQ